jgi:hypothetical protein
MHSTMKKNSTTNDFEIKKPEDLTKINSNNMGELVWWSHYLGISPEKILSIIHKAGSSIEEVKKHIN